MHVFNNLWMLYIIYLQSKYSYYKQLLQFSKIVQEFIIISLSINLYQPKTQNMLIARDKRTKILQNQCSKLRQIHQLQLTNNHFWLGYLAAFCQQPVQPEKWLFLMNTLQNTSNLIDDGLFSDQNMMQLILAANDNQVCRQSREKWLDLPGIDISRLAQFMAKNIQELSIDNSYLCRKYFTDQLKQEMVPEIVRKVNSQIGLQCPICCEHITLSTVCPISCSHLLHKSCFTQYFKDRVENKSFPVRCPMEGCEEQIPITDIQEYISGQILNKYYEFSLHALVDKNHKKMGWCPTAGCSAAYQFESVQQADYQCPSCNKKYCLKCKTQTHQNLTCQEYRQQNNLPPQQQQFMKFVKGKQYKQCPSCKFWVSKNRGCDHITCKCEHEFCYRCGADYGTCECQQNDSFYDSHGSGDENEQEDIEKQMRNESD